MEQPLLPESEEWTKHRKSFSLKKGKYISYANCGLPYYIGDVITDREKLFVQTPEAFSVRFRVDVRTENEVIFIDRKKKQ